MYYEVRTVQRVDGGTQHDYYLLVDVWEKQADARSGKPPMYTEDYHIRRDNPELTREDLKAIFVRVVDQSVKSRASTGKRGGRSQILRGDGNEQDDLKPPGKSV